MGAGVAPGVTPFPPAPVPSIAAQVAAEAAEAARRRQAARAVGHRGGPKLSAGAVAAALQADLIDTPQDAMRAVARRWPALWRRIVDDARDAGALPGAYFFDVVERGLDAMGEAGRG